MGYTKKATHEREQISGHHVAVDVQDGSHGAEDLARRNASRQDAINAAHKADWPKDMTSNVPEAQDPILSYTMTKLAKPTDYSAHGEDRFGVSGGTDANPGTTANQSKPAPRSNSKAVR